MHGGCQLQEQNGLRLSTVDQEEVQIKIYNWGNYGCQGLRYEYELLRYLQKPNSTNLTQP